MGDVWMRLGHLLDKYEENQNHLIKKLPYRQFHFMQKYIF